MRSPNRIGIVGGGQLGRMLTPDAKRLGYEVVVLDPTPHCPASSVGAEQILAGLTDELAIKRLAEVSTFVTFEIEHVNTQAFRRILSRELQVNPSPETLELIKDKLAQKQFLQKAGIPVAPFAPVESEADILEVAQKLHFPLILKSRFGGYDGRGNAVIKNAHEISAAWRKLAGSALYVEQCVDFKKELAIMVARGINGDIATYPVVETIHVNNICHTVIAPAPVSADIKEKASMLARKTMELLQGAGVFGIEMFLTRDKQIVLNEIAPRVHNSGHYTIEACSTSQFEQHIRAITGLPLGSTELHTPAAVMVNILGNRQGKAQVRGLAEALKIPKVSIHFYGKAETKPERKMGHITACADTWQEAKAAAETARKLISI